MGETRVNLHHLLEDIRDSYPFPQEEKINLSEMMQFEKSNAFKIHFGKKGKPVGVGFVRKYKDPLDEEKRGVAISTCGKVIKHGWDWLGISARNPDYISGVVEMPGFIYLNGLTIFNLNF